MDVLRLSFHLARRGNVDDWYFGYHVSVRLFLMLHRLAYPSSSYSVQCAAQEFLEFDPSAGSTCGAYMADYISGAGGYLLDPQATSNCQFCQLESTDVFLATFGMSYSHAWRNFGILIAYCVFNVFAAMALYYFVRVVSSSGFLLGVGRCG